MLIILTLSQAQTIEEQSIMSVVSGLFRLVHLGTHAQRDTLGITRWKKRIGENLAEVLLIIYPRWNVLQYAHF